MFCFKVYLKVLLYFVDLLMVLALFIGGLATLLGLYEPSARVLAGCALLTLGEVMQMAYRQRTTASILSQLPTLPASSGDKKVVEGFAAKREG